MKNFDDDFLFQLSTEDIATIFTASEQHAERIVQSGACAGLTPENAKIMANSFAIAFQLLRLYNDSIKE